MSVDPLAVLSAVTSIVESVIQWMDAHKDQEAMLTDIHITLRNIQGSILAPLSQRHPLDDRMGGPLYILQDILLRTQEHVEVYFRSREISKKAKLWAFLNPWALLDQLKKDKEDLMSSMQILTTAMIAIYIPGQKAGASQAYKTPPISIASNKEVRDFWQKEIGQQASYCSAEVLVQALRRYLKKSLDKGAKNALALRLDEYGVGCITLSSLDNFIGKRSLLDAMMDLGIIQELLLTKVNRRPKSWQGQERSHIKPILLVIEDVPETQQGIIAFARSLGIDVYLFTSSASAKGWIKGNEGMLRDADRLSKLRILSDNARWEWDKNPSGQGAAQTSINLRAGEMLLRYLRGRQYTAPVLIVGFKSIPQTTYIRNYTKAGSTSNRDVMQDFIRPLASKSGFMDDEWWVDFDVKPKDQVKPLLIWVDDQIENQKSFIEYAKPLVQVVTLDSTELAKTWIKANELLVRRMDRAKLLRFISDNTRFEGPFQQGAKKSLNKDAGKQILEFVRSNGYRAPFLILCSNTSLTPYVTKYSGAGSTARSEVCKEFIQALSQRRHDDRGWATSGP